MPTVASTASTLVGIALSSSAVESRNGAPMTGFVPLGRPAGEPSDVAAFAVRRGLDVFLARTA
jgi:hypothetical protein